MIIIRGILFDLVGYDKDSLGVYSMSIFKFLDLFNPDLGQARSMLNY